MPCRPPLSAPPLRPASPLPLPREGRQGGREREEGGVGAEWAAWGGGREAGVIGGGSASVACLSEVVGLNRPAASSSIRPPFPSWVGPPSGGELSHGSYQLRNGRRMDGGLAVGSEADEGAELRWLAEDGAHGGLPSREAGNEAELTIEWRQQRVIGGYIDWRERGKNNKDACR